MTRYVYDTIQQRYLAVVVEGRDLLLVDVERPETPPYAISSAFLHSEERFIEVEVADTCETAIGNNPSGD